MKKSKSNLTGEATFTVETRQAGKGDWKVSSTHGSVTPCNKASFAEVKAALAATPDGRKRLYTGRPDLGYTVTEVTKTEAGEQVATILEVRVTMTSKVAKKTWVGADASLAARRATLKPWERAEPQAEPKA